ncbi:MAG TPA: CHAT domain-containing protein, partial [Thermoanaerobaculia bacterium]|nr:CHAT domain-containing protein [Thermoanaerobaculia bacterium]
MSMEQASDAEERTVSTGPDLLLVIEERPGSEGRTFDVRLKLKDLELEMKLPFGTHGEIPFKSDPAHILQQHLKEIGDAGLRTEQQKSAFAKLLGAKGAFLSREILPASVRKCLSWLQGKATTLQVISEAPWIPWEILRIESRPESDDIDGPFLCEAFALTRWLPNQAPAARLPLGRIAVIVPDDSDLPCSSEELSDMESLRAPNRGVERVTALAPSVVEALRRGEHDGWHFSTHGRFDHYAPDLSEIWLQDEEKLTPVHLSQAKLWDRRPLVFLNACSSGQSGLSLTSVGGWAAHFLAAGAGAYIGALWPIYDCKARDFARAFYRELFAGRPIAEAVRTARRSSRTEDNPTWLAYTVFADPLAVSTAGDDPPARETASAATGGDEGPLTIPHFPWDPEISPPGALLRADYGIVRFHGRDKDLSDLRTWCTGPERIKVRLYTGPGGMGKTRFALHISSELRGSGWQSGFLNEDASLPPAKAWEILARRGGRMLIVIDYAETRRDLVVEILKRSLNY